MILAFIGHPKKFKFLPSPDVFFFDETIDD